MKELSGFERFTQAKTEKLYVSIRSHGQIAISTDLSKKLNLQKYSYAVLYHNKPNNQFAIVFTNNEQEEGRTRIYHRRCNCHMRATYFCKFMGFYGSTIKKLPIADIGSDYIIVSTNK
jgi:hypothetical protein